MITLEANGFSIGRNALAPNVLAPSAVTRGSIAATRLRKNKVYECNCASVAARVLIWAARHG